MSLKIMLRGGRGKGSPRRRVQLRAVRETAGELYLSVNTVKTHQHHLYRKLDVRTRTEAVERARALSLLAPSSRRPLEQTGGAVTTHGARGRISSGSRARRRPCIGQTRRRSWGRSAPGL
jgi:hypothetical protein